MNMQGHPNVCQLSKETSETMETSRLATGETCQYVGGGGGGGGLGGDPVGGGGGGGGGDGGGGLGGVQSIGGGGTGGGGTCMRSSCEKPCCKSAQHAETIAPLGT